MQAVPLDRFLRYWSYTYSHDERLVRMLAGWLMAAVNRYRATGPLPTDLPAPIALSRRAVASPVTCWYPTATHLIGPLKSGGYVAIPVSVVARLVATIDGSEFAAPAMTEVA